MFKKDLTPGAKSKVKSSVQRAIRAKAVETYPLLAPHMDEIMPKKSQLDLIKLPDRISLYTLSTSSTSPPTPLFWQHMDDPLIPHLKLVHAFPTCFTHLGIDRGAIRFVLSGAALMAPGLTSKGGYLPSSSQEDEDEDEDDDDDDDDDDEDDEDDDDSDPGQKQKQKQKQPPKPPVKEGDVVVIRAEGKDEACLVGQLKVSVDEIKRVGKGVVMDSGHYLGDGLWRLNLD